MQTETATPPAEFDAVSFVMAFEAGELDDDEIVAGFQHLIDTGAAWRLQGVYGRTAARLIEAGLCQPASRKE